MSESIRGISSMATRQVLAELAAAYEAATGVRVAIESVGGVEAARRVQENEPFDVVILATDAIDKLLASGKAVAGTKTDLVRSGIALAVRAGAAKPDVSTDDALQRAVLAARNIGYSTGPSGTALLKLFERWGIAAELAPRLVQAPPGVPVGSMVANGDVELGFQQLSELIHLDGIALAGELPPSAQVITVFSGAACAAARDIEGVRRLLAFMAAPSAAAVKRRHGMEPA